MPLSFVGDEVAHSMSTDRATRVDRSLETVLDWTPEMGVYFFDHGEAMSWFLICEGETDGFETH